MGLLTGSTGEPDFNAALTVAKIVQRWWNEKQAPVYGFRIALYKGSLEDCCTMGAELFSGPNSYFADPPGPFKRTSAFVVLGRLHPFFNFEDLEGGGGNVPTSDDDKHAWIARIMALAIPVVLNGTKTILGDEERTLNTWPGFPSQHFKLEFLAWVRWLDPFEEYRAVIGDRWTSFAAKRLARMVMATSLMIEACYYSDPTHSNGICGNTGSCLQKMREEHELDLIYDIYHPPVPPEFTPGS